MPQCLYCKEWPYAAGYSSFILHVERCQKIWEAERRLERKKQKIDRLKRERREHQKRRQRELLGLKQKIAQFQKERQQFFEMKQEKELFEARQKFPAQSERERRELKDLFEPTQKSAQPEKELLGPTQKLAQPEKELRELFEANQKLQAQLQSQVTRVTHVTNNYHIENMVMGNQINAVYLDYPKSEFTDYVVKLTETLDITQIRTKDDLNKIIAWIKEYNGQIIANYLKGDDRRLRSQASSLLGNVARILRERLERETPSNTILIEAVGDYEQDYLQNID